MGTLSVASLAALVAASWLVKIRSTPALTRPRRRRPSCPAFLGEADVERHVAAVYEAELLEPGLEPFDGRMARRPRRVEDADPERARRLLRLAHVGGRPEKNRHGDPEAARSSEAEAVHPSHRYPDTNWW